MHPQHKAAKIWDSSWIRIPTICPLMTRLPKAPTMSCTFSSAETGICKKIVRECLVLTCK